MDIQILINKVINNKKYDLNEFIYKYFYFSIDKNIFIYIYSFLIDLIN